MFWLIKPFHDISLFQCHRVTVSLMKTSQKSNAYICMCVCVCFWFLFISSYCGLILLFIYLQLFRIHSAFYLSPVILDSFQFMFIFLSTSSFQLNDQDQTLSYSSTIAASQFPSNLLELIGVVLADSDRLSREPTVLTLWSAWSPR